MNLRHVATILAVTLLGNAPALAQSEGRLPGFQLERLELNPSGTGSWLVGTGELAPAGQLRVSVLGHHEQAPLTFYHSELGHSVVVKSRLTTHVLAAWSATKHLELGFQLPFILRQDTGSLSNAGLTAPASSGLSTPYFHVRLGLLEQRADNPLDVALELGSGLPLGSDVALARDDGFRFAPKVMVGRAFDVLRVGAEAGVLLQPSVILSREASRVRDELGNELRFGASLSTRNEGLRGELALRGALPLVRSPASMEVLGGGRYALANGWEVFALGAMGFGSSPGTPRFRAILGFSFGGNLRQPDNQEDCARTGSCATPAAPKEDAGIRIVRKDSDEDDVLDAVDNCPRTPGPVENQGCPGAPQRVIITERQLLILDKVYFEFDRHVIQPISYPLLDQVANVLKEHPEFEKIAIEGHTDSVGSDGHNRQLSLRRAEAVREYLVRRGTDGALLETRGFGEERPVLPNTTDENRSINRRVEFHILSVKQTQPAPAARVSFR
jgi:outer membrane protein OmpA-like peptidoglycan-associated protein